MSVARGLKTSDGRSESYSSVHVKEFKFSAHKIWTSLIFDWSGEFCKKINGTIKFFKQFTTDIVTLLGLDFLLNTLSDLGKWSKLTLRADRESPFCTYKQTAPLHFTGVLKKSKASKVTLSKSVVKC